MVEVNQWNLCPIQLAQDPLVGSRVEDWTRSVEAINSYNRYLHLCLYFIFEFRYAHLNNDHFLHMQCEVIRYETGSGHQKNTLQEIQFASEKLD
jgi:hypothetical protein